MNPLWLNSARALARASIVCVSAIALTVPVACAGTSFSSNPSDTAQSGPDASTTTLTTTTATTPTDATLGAPDGLAIEVGAPADAVYITPPADSPVWGDAAAAAIACAECVGNSCGNAAADCNDDPNCVATLNCAFADHCFGADADAGMASCVTACSLSLDLTLKQEAAVLTELTKIATCGAPCADTCARPDAL